jgi:O-antigen/teichoic acid export membrane protein
VKPADPTHLPVFEEQTFRELALRLSTTSSVYTAGLIALRFGGLLLIPLYWRYLDPQDYGVIAAAAVVSSFLSVFLGLGISEAVTRFYHAWPASDRARRLGSIWVFDWASSLLVGVPLALWGGAIVQLAAVHVSFAPYLQLAVVASTLASLATAPTTLLRVQERAGLYVALSAASFAIRTAAAVYLVVFERLGPFGILLADVVAAGAMVPIYAAVMLGSARPAWDPHALRQGLGYSLPLVPGIFAESLMFTMDRFVLEKFVPLASLGLYAVGDSLGGIVRIVGSGLKTAWLPFQIRAAGHRADGGVIIARAATFYVAATLSIGLAVALTMGDIIVLIGVPKYFPVAGLVPLFVIPSVLTALLPLALGGLGIARRTGFASIAAVAQLLVGAIALIVLVPPWGIYGALLAVGLGAFVRLATGLFFAQRFYPVPFEWRKIFLLLIGALAVFLASRAIPSGFSAAGAAVRLALAIAYPFVCGWSVLGGRRLWAARRARTA